MGGRVGSPSALTQELSDKICNLVRSGMKPKSAAALSGVNGTRFDRWHSYGKLAVEGREDPTKLKYKHFYLALRKAEAELSGACMQTLVKKALGSRAVFDAQNNVIAEAVAADPEWAFAILKMSNFARHIGSHEEDIEKTEASSQSVVVQVIYPAGIEPLEDAPDPAEQAAGGDAPVDSPR